VTRLLAAAVGAGLLLASGRVARAQSRESTEALRRWVAAVRTHEPGKADSAAQVVAGLMYSDRLTLYPAMSMFLAAVGGESIAAKSAEQRQILDLYRSLRRDLGPGAFLERAAVLHADAAIFRDKDPDFVDDAPPSPRGHRSPELPLLENEFAMLHTDGRVVGQASLKWNWTFARSLLDLLKQPADLAFMAEWYHATAAYMLGAGHHADLKRHLIHAAAVLPDDPHILFDRGCYAETLGLPLYQVLSGDAGYWSAASRVRIDVPAEDKTDNEAEKLFRHAIDVDATYAEARVRLARLLERRGVHDEAAAQIDQAIASGPVKTVAYFAHLVAGRIELARGRPHESFGHYRAALAMFPDAQSALVGASQAAVMATDVPAAMTLVQKLGESTARFDADPWWNYHLGAGRDVDDLMVALWARVPK
jgi:tetratricopeptide (TPR) repeat protein